MKSKIKERLLTFNFKADLDFVKIYLDWNTHVVDCKVSFWMYGSRQYFISSVAWVNKHICCNKSIYDLVKNEINKEEY